MGVKRDEKHPRVTGKDAQHKEDRQNPDDVSLRNEDKNIADRLRESEERFRLMFEQASVGMAFASLEGMLTQVNERYCEITGYSAAELHNRSISALTHPDDQAKQVAAFQNLLQHKVQVSPIEKRYVRPDGSFVWVNVATTLIRDAQDIPLYYMAVVVDITARKNIEVERDAIAQREQASKLQAQQAASSAAAQASQLETIFAAMTDSIFVYDQVGNVLQINAAVRELLALDLLPDYAMLPPQQRLGLLDTRDAQGNTFAKGMEPMMRILRGEVLNGGNATDATVRALDGRHVQINVSGAPLRDPHGQIVGGVMVMRDVTDRRHLEERTQTALAGLLTMAQALVQFPTHSGTDLEDEKGEMYVIGRRLAELTRDILDCQRVGLVVVEPETGVQRPLSVVGLTQAQEDVWWQEQTQQADGMQVMAPQIFAALRSNEVLILDMTQPPLDVLPNPYESKHMLIAPMRLGERVVGLLSLDYGSADHAYSKGDTELASAVATLSALVIERQRLLSEQADARGREVALQEANRRMEEFLGIASHELRTPLTTIKANVQLAKRRLKNVSVEPTPTGVASKVDAAYGMLSRAERQVGVLNRLVGDLIDISRIQTGKLQLHLRREPVDLLQIVEESVQEQQKTVPNRSITLTLPNTDLLVIADSDRIAQVLTNYLTNALKYSASDKPVAVLMTRAENEHGEAVACVAVRDEGPGLSAEEQLRIWECFYQAETVQVVSGSGVGLGLGLYISQTIITRHNGQVGVDSTPGVGSTFWFTLPLVQSEDMLANEE